MAAKRKKKKTARKDTEPGKRKAGKYSTAALRIPAQQSLGEIHQGLSERFGVRGCYLGQKSIDDEYTRRTSLVCIVDKKKPKSELSRSEKIPKRYRYTALGRTHSIQTDVIQKHGCVRTQALFNPGDRIRGTTTNGAVRNATIGAFGMHADHGPVFITAGHFAEQVDRRRVLKLHDASSNPPQTVTGHFIGTPRSDSGVDYSLIRASQVAPNQFGNVPLNAIYEPVLLTDLNRQLLVLTRGGQVPTICRGLFMSYTDPNTNQTLTQLIVTDPVTQGGDSGAALVDDSFRLWGFVIGIVTFRTSAGFLRSVSVYMPAVRLLASENITIG